MADAERAIRAGFERDHIEAHAQGPHRVFSQPGCGAAGDPRLLGPIDGGFRSAVAAGTPRLHLDEDPQAPAARDQIEFDTAGADVPPNDPVPFALQVLRSQALSLLSQGASVRRHGMLQRDPGRDRHCMGTLYVVATPIGNLEDVTLRSLRILAEVDQVLAEDTRRTRTLLDRHQISTRARSLHAHNEAARSEEVLADLAAGAAIALVSDAGTPLVSDPGERLVARAAEAGHDVVPIPGPSAVMSALVASGLLATPFTFVGFLPRKAGARGARLSELAARSETLVLFESPKRLAATLGELAKAFGADRQACVARELTKLHEEITRGTLAALVERHAEEPRGEISIVVAGAVSEDVDAESLRPLIKTALERGESARDLSTALHRETGAPRREIYRIALELRDALR